MGEDQVGVTRRSQRQPALSGNRGAEGFAGRNTALRTESGRGTEGPARLAPAKGERLDHTTARREPYRIGAEECSEGKGSIRPS
jgi:hypothetical protein